MDYKHFEVQDFLTDEFFVSWVLNEDAATAHFWKKWLKAHPEKRTEVENAKELIRSVHYKHTNRLTDTEYSSMFEKVLRTSEHHQNNAFGWLSKYAFRIAASVIFILVALFLYQRNEKEIPTSPDFRLAKTELGQRKTIKLPDGTMVKLNVGSTLEYPERFEGTTRSVSLVGEAFFDVSEDKTKPFIIQSSDLYTEVLGTSFNLSAYPEKDSITVAVVSGRVMISNESGMEEVLSPTDLGVFSKQSKSIVKRKFDDRILAWSKGILIIENQSLPDVFEMLERWYGVKVEFADGINLEGTYSGRYQNKSLELVLEGISYTSHIKYSINNKKIRIYE